MQCLSDHGIQVTETSVLLIPIPLECIHLNLIVFELYLIPALSHSDIIAWEISEMVRKIRIRTPFQVDG